MKSATKRLQFIMNGSTVGSVKIDRLGLLLDCKPTAFCRADSRGGLYVADRDNHRVLYFANDGDTTADWVFGFKLRLSSGVCDQTK